MGDEADADWDAGFVEWGIEDTKRRDICIDCDGEGRYPSRAVCKSCAGTGRVCAGDGIRTQSGVQH